NRVIGITFPHLLEQTLITSITPGSHPCDYSCGAQGDIRLPDNPATLHESRVDLWWTCLHFYDNI
ncbi:hypothetical protein AVEN_255467-1, partial [Araneus ventricosus]